MKPIRVWICQDRYKHCFAYKSKPKIATHGEFDSSDNFISGYLGERKLTPKQSEKPIKCVIISEDEYKALKELH